MLTSNNLLNKNFYVYFVNLVKILYVRQFISNLTKVLHYRCLLDLYICYELLLCIILSIILRNLYIVFNFIM